MAALAAGGHAAAGSAWWGVTADKRPLPVAGIVVAIALLYAATGWLPHRRSE